MTESLFSDVGANLYFVMEIIGYLIFTFIGSLLKEIFNTNSVNGYGFQAHRVISSTIASTITSSALRSLYMQEYSYPVMALVSFTLGLLGFELFKNMCSVEGIKKLVSDFNKIYTSLTQLPNPNNRNSTHIPPESSNDYDNNHKDIESSGFTPNIRIHTNHKKDDGTET